MNSLIYYFFTQNTYSLLAITAAVRVDPLFPPHPTSITLAQKTLGKKDKILRSKEIECQKPKMDGRNGIYPSLGTRVSVLNSYPTVLGFTIQA